MPRIQNAECVMITCEICGNDFDAGTRVCPYCESPVMHTEVTAGQRRSQTGRNIIRVVNLKADQPSVRDAEAHLHRELTRMLSMGVHVMKLIHGYGSSGQGGSIRDRVHVLCRQLRGSGGIQGFILGEDFHTRNEATNRLIRRLPQLRSDSDLNRGNRGISLLILR